MKSSPLVNCSASESWDCSPAGLRPAHKVDRVEPELLGKTAFCPYAARMPSHTPPSPRLTRRRFLGAAGSTLVAATALAKAAPTVVQREVEVLVCGGGCAGLAAT